MTDERGDGERDPAESWTGPDDDIGESPSEPAPADDIGESPSEPAPADEQTTEAADDTSQSEPTTDAGDDLWEDMDDGREPESGTPPADEPATDAGGESDTKFCLDCGSSIAASAETCPECGVRQPDVAGGGPDRVPAALLAIFLGITGAHRFYLGDVGLGLLYLCFAWTALPALVGLVEGVVFLAKSDEEFTRQYGG